MWHSFLLRIFYSVSYLGGDAMLTCLFGACLMVASAFLFFEMLYCFCLNVLGRYSDNALYCILAECLGGGLFGVGFYLNGDLGFIPLELFIGGVILMVCLILYCIYIFVDSFVL